MDTVLVDTQLQKGKPELEVTNELYFQKCDALCQPCPARDIFHKELLNPTKLLIQLKLNL